MTVAAVIPNWNHAVLLRECLDSLAAQTTPFDEILVVDNGSEDNSAAVARTAGARVLALARNEGFARAVNHGVRETTANWVAVLNNDVRLAPDWLAQILPAVQRAGAAFATGKLLQHDQPGLLDGAFDLPTRSGCVWRAGHGVPDTADWNQPRPIHSAPLAACLLRREGFLALGGLDERFESYLEDADYGIRAALAGHKGLYWPAARAWHRGSATLGSWSPRLVRLLSRNQMYLIAKHFPQDWWWQYGWPAILGQLLWGAVCLRHGTFRAWLRGKREGIGNWLALRSHAPLKASAEARALAQLLTESEAELARLGSLHGLSLVESLYLRLTGH
jgi:GT2 family glycosyltransferase